MSETRIRTESKFDLGTQPLEKGVYKVSVTKTLQLTVLSDCTAKESILITDTLTLGVLDSWKVEKVQA